MVVSYNDIFMDRILPGLERLLEEEFGTTLPIYVSDEYKDMGTESLRLEPIDALLEVEGSKSETRFYAINGSYYTEIKPGRERIKEIMRRLGRINRIVINNRFYTFNSVIQWIDAQMLNFGRREPEDHEPEGIAVGFFEFQCTATEAIS